MKISDIHPELRKAAAFYGAVMPHMTLSGAKAAQALFSARKYRAHGMKFEEKYVTRIDGSELRLCVYSSPEPRKNVPGLLWIHGGGYLYGEPERGEIYIRRFIEESGCVVVSPDYTLSLDKPYPAAWSDCCNALLWLKDHGGEYGQRSDQLFVGGDSAGGGLAAAVSLYARDSGTAAIAFQMPLYPMLDDRPTETSRDNDAPIWNTKSNTTAWKQYLGDLYGTDGVPVYAAPARCADYKNLPPTCTFAGSIEPFLAETETYVKNLRACGIPTHFRVFDNCFHSFDTICARSNVAGEANAFLMETFKYAVGNYFAEQPD